MYKNKTAMSKQEITIEGVNYWIEGDNYNGDLLLLSEKQDINIQCGYIELKGMAESEGYFDFQEYLNMNLTDFIMKNYRDSMNQHRTITI